MVYALTKKNSCTPNRPAASTESSDPIPVGIAAAVWTAITPRIDRPRSRSRLGSRLRLFAADQVEKRLPASATLAPVGQAGLGADLGLNLPRVIGCSAADAAAAACDPFLALAGGG